MNSRNVGFLAAAALAISAVTPALAQSTSGAGSTAGTAAGAGQQTQQSSQTQGVPDQGSVTTGSNTAATRNKDGASGVGMTTAPNGKPIGSPGSGLGSPEEPWDAKKLR